MKDDRTWYRDRAAETTFRVLEEEVGPIIDRLLPKYRMTHFGVLTPTSLDLAVGRNEIVLQLHLRPLGEAWAIEQRLCAMRDADSLSLDWTDKP
jgi:hypothetical protein